MTSLTRIRDITDQINNKTDQIPINDDIHTPEYCYDQFQQLANKVQSQLNASVVTKQNIDTALDTIWKCIIARMRIFLRPSYVQEEYKTETHVYPIETLLGLIKIIVTNPEEVFNRNTKIHFLSKQTIKNRKIYRTTEQLNKAANNLDIPVHRFNVQFMVRVNSPNNSNTSSSSSEVDYFSKEAYEQPPELQNLRTYMNNFFNYVKNAYALRNKQESDPEVQQYVNNFPTITSELLVESFLSDEIMTFYANAPETANVVISNTSLVKPGVSFREKATPQEKKDTPEEVIQQPSQNISLKLNTSRPDNNTTST